MNIDAKYSIKFSQKIKEHIKTIIHHDQVGFIQECRDGSIYKMFTNTITHYRKKSKRKTTQSFISLDAEKSFDKI